MPFHPQEASDRLMGPDTHTVNLITILITHHPAPKLPKRKTTNKISGWDVISKEVWRQLNCQCTPQNIRYTHPHRNSSTPIEEVHGVLFIGFDSTSIHGRYLSCPSIKQCYWQLKVLLNNTHYQAFDWRHNRPMMGINKNAYMY
jgi:hypothetical protein